MSETLWTLHSKIEINCAIDINKNISSICPIDKTIKQIIISPDIDANQKPTGISVIDVVFVIEKEGEIKPEVVADKARYLLRLITGLLSYLSGQPVRIISNPSIKHQIQNTNEFRCILLGEQKSIIPPSILRNTSLFQESIKAEIYEIMHLLNYGLNNIEDIVVCFIILFSSLELLSNQFKIEGEVVDTCEKCGNIKRSRPGTKKKMQILLTEKLGYSNPQFEEVWEIRNRISHGNFGLHDEERRQLIQKSELIYGAIIKGVDNLLGLEQAGIRINPFSPFIDPLLDIKYEAPEKNES